MTKIEKIEFWEQYHIKLYLTNGHAVIYNLYPRIKTARFFHLSDEKLFKEGQIVRGDVIKWDGMTEVSLEEIMYDINTVAK